MALNIMAIHHDADLLALHHDADLLAIHHDADLLAIYNDADLLAIHHDQHAPSLLERPRQHLQGRHGLLQVVQHLEEGVLV